MRVGLMMGDDTMPAHEVDRAAIGERMRQARKDAELTQDQLAASLDITKVLLSHYECGRRLLPVEVAFKLARQHKVSLDWLYGFKPRRAR